MTNAQLCVRLFVRWESDIEDWKLIMLKLYILLAVVVWLAMQSQKNTQARLAAGVQSFHARRMDMWCVLLFLALLYVAGLRTSFNDTQNYISGFRRMPAPAEWWDNQDNWNIFHNPAFYFLESWLRSKTDNAQIFIFLTAAFTEFSMVRFFKRHVENFPFSIFLFLTLGTFCFTLAAIKQCLAMAILTYAITALKDNKWVRYYLLVFLAMLFHTYALAFVFLPLFRAKPWSWFTYLFVLALVLVMLNFESAITSFLDFAGEQGKDIAEYEVFDDHGTNIFRVLVYAVVPAMSLIFQKKLFENSTPEENVLVHMSIISLAFMLLGTFAGANMFGRMGNYFELGTICCLPWMLRKCFQGKPYRLICIAAVVGFLAYFTYAYGFHTPFDQNYSATTIWALLRSA